MPFRNNYRQSFNHFSATGFRESAMKYRNEQIAGMGSDEGSEFKLRTVDPARVRAVRAIAEKALG